VLEAPIEDAVVAEDGPGNVELEKPCVEVVCVELGDVEMALDIAVLVEGKERAKVEEHRPPGTCRV
jgi:hypothetical protein